MQVLSYPFSRTEAISLQSADSALEVQPKSKTEIPIREELTRYRPPGTMKKSVLALSVLGVPIKAFKLIFLAARGGSAPKSLRCFFLNALQSSTHLWGAIADLSSSKSLMSDMGKLGRKRVLSRHTRWSAATQTTRCRVLSWRALQVWIKNNTSLVWARESSDVDVHDAVPKYQTDGDTSRYRSAHPRKCLRASAGSTQPSPLKPVRQSNFELGVITVLEIVTYISDTCIFRRRETSSHRPKQAPSPKQPLVVQLCIANSTKHTNATAAAGESLEFFSNFSGIFVESNGLSAKIVRPDDSGRTFLSIMFLSISSIRFF